MARPVFGRRERTARGGVVPLDRDRPLVEAARRDPAQFDALYRKYLAQVYAYALYELADHHAAEDATERDVPARARGPAAVPRARAPRGRPRGVDLPRLAVPDRAQRRRERAAIAAPAAGRVARGRAGRRAGRRGRRGHRGRRDDSATRRPRPCARCDRLPDDRRRALLLRFVDEMSTAEIAGVLGRSEGAVRVLIHRGAGVGGAGAGSGPGRDPMTTGTQPRRRPGGGRRPRGGPTTSRRSWPRREPATDADDRAMPGLDPETRRAVDAVRRALVRVHPSFRFEERLADRLASLAGASAGNARRRRPVPRPAARRGGRRPAAPGDPRGRARPGRRPRPRPRLAHRRRPPARSSSAARSRPRRCRSSASPGSPGAPPGSRPRPTSRPSRASSGGSADAPPVPRVPHPARGLPGVDVDALPVVRGAAVQQAAREGHARLPDVRPPLPARRDRPPRAAAGRGLVRGARRRAGVRGPARVRRPEGVPGPGGRRPAGHRPA